MAQSGGESKKVLNTILFMQHNVSIVVPGVLIVAMVQRKISRKKKQWSGGLGREDKHHFALLSTF